MSEWKDGKMVQKAKNRGIKKAKKEQRREEAEARQEKHNLLTPRQKLEKLDRRLGKDKGASKERARLQKIIDGGV